MKKPATKIHVVSEPYVISTEREARVEKSRGESRATRYEILRLRALRRFAQNDVEATGICS